MTYAIALIFEGVSEDDYWAVNNKLGIAPGQVGGDAIPPGAINHVAGASANGWVVIETWESREAQQAFMSSELGAALMEAGLPAPAQVIDFDVVNTLSAK
jgi:hypothetical protein